MKWAAWIERVDGRSRRLGFVARSVLRPSPGARSKKIRKVRGKKYAELFWRDENETIAFRTPDLDDEALQ